MRLNHLYKELQVQYEAAALLPAKQEAKWLLREVCGLEEEVFISQPDLEITKEQEQAVWQAAKRRMAGEPLSRIIGKREFWGLEFALSGATLDPRPDTETLVEAVLKSLKGREKDPLNILDMGTGTGCILIALLSELPNARGYALDLSFEALKTATQNAATHKMRDRFYAVQGSWMEAFQPGYFDLIVSNPPYIEESDIENLSCEVKNHDPVLALSGGKTGLDCYEKIIFNLKTHLNSHNRAFLEIGIGQVESLQRLVDDSNLCLCDSVADIAGIPRVVEICRGDK